MPRCCRAWIQRFGSTATISQVPPPSGINLLPLTSATQLQGLLRYLEEQQPERLRRGGLAIGYDGRHGSRHFALIAAAACAARGVPAWLFSELVPTPFVPAAVEQLVRVEGWHEGRRGALRLLSVRGRWTAVGASTSG